VIDVVTVITAKGENIMTSTPETGTAPAPAAEEPKATKKASRCATGRPRCARRRESSAKKATPAKKAPKGAKKATAARDGSKTNRILDLLKRPGGVTSKGADEGHWLAAAFRAWIPVRHHRQERWA
jgi:hypothetical protein